MMFPHGVMHNIRRMWEGWELGDRTTPYEYESTAGSTYPPPEYTGYVRVLAEQGWQCPQCLTIYAPHIERCECAKKPGVTTSNANDDKYTVIGNSSE